eukprot:580364-Pyramimonas_sp.AAC.1
MRGRPKKKPPKKKSEKDVDLSPTPSAPRSPTPPPAKHRKWTGSAGADPGRYKSQRSVGELACRRRSRGPEVAAAAA